MTTYDGRLRPSDRDLQPTIRVELQTEEEALTTHPPVILVTSTAYNADATDLILESRICRAHS